MFERYSPGQPQWRPTKTAISRIHDSFLNIVIIHFWWPDEEDVFQKWKMHSRLRSTTVCPKKKSLELLIKEIKIRQHYFHKLYMEKELVYDKNYNEEMFPSFL